jgi:hypothetical protein
MPIAPPVPNLNFKDAAQNVEQNPDLSIITAAGGVSITTATNSVGGTSTVGPVQASIPGSLGTNTGGPTPANVPATTLLVAGTPPTDSTGGNHIPGTGPYNIMNLPMLGAIKPLP